jgi:hypothetical protein
VRNVAGSSSTSVYYQWVAVLFIIWPTGPLAEEVTTKDLIYRNSAMFDLILVRLLGGHPAVAFMLI